MAEARIYADLKADHDRHRALFAKMEASERGSDERRTLFEELRKELQAHAAAEEESLYTLMLANPDLRDEARHSVSEHKEIDELLGALADVPPQDLGWITALRALRHRYFHHIDEEEEEMFPAATKELPKAKEDEAAKVFEQRKPAELARAETEQPGDERE